MHTKRLCPDDKELNPNTNRCVNRCKEGQIRNENFRCVKEKTPKVAKKAKSPKSKKNSTKKNSPKKNSPQRFSTPKCSDDKELNPYTGRCVSKCKNGYYRDNETFRCKRKIFSDDPEMIEMNRQLEERFMAEQRDKYENDPETREKITRIMDNSTIIKTILHEVLKTLKSKKYSINMIELEFNRINQYLNSGIIRKRMYEHEPITFANITKKLNILLNTNITIYNALEFERDVKILHEIVYTFLENQRAERMKR